jgi:hypothetical protein
MLNYKNNKNNYLLLKQFGGNVDKQKLIEIITNSSDLSDSDKKYSKQAINLVKVDIFNSDTMNDNTCKKALDMLLKIVIKLKNNIKSYPDTKKYLIFEQYGIRYIKSLFKINPDDGNIIFTGDLILDFFNNLISFYQHINDK